MHFVELYSAFKNGIQGLSLLVGAPKCPTKHAAYDDDIEDCGVSLKSYTMSKKGTSKKW